jgi:hypothetical protein
VKQISMIVAAFLLAAGSVQATIVNPDGSGDYPTLQAAIDAIPNGGSDTLLLGSGTFSGPGNRQLQVSFRNLRFQSLASDSSLCGIDTDGLPLFSSILDGFNGEFQGIGFLDCGLILSSPSGLDFRNCRFSFVAGGLYGFFGGIDVQDSEFTGCIVPPVLEGEAGSLTVTSCRFIDNATDFGDPGGAFQDCLFRGNVSPAGALFSHTFDEIGFPYGGFSFYGCRFEDNHAEPLLEMISAPSNSGTYLLTLDDCVFWRNEGTIAALVDVHPHFTNCSFVENYGAGTSEIDLSCVACLGDAAYLWRNIHAYREEGLTIAAGPGVTPPTVHCSDFYQTPTGAYVPVDCLGADPGFCGRQAGDLTLLTSSPCLPENNACGMLMGAEGQGCEDVTGVAETAPAAAILSAHPNPFNPSTRLAIDLPAPAAVQLSAYALDGRRLAVLLAGRTLPAGRHSLDWDGRDAAGRPMASGVYLLVLEAGGQWQSLKLTLLR